MSKYFKWGAIALLIFYVVTQPANAAGLVHSAIGGLENIGTGMGQFVTNVTP